MMSALSFGCAIDMIRCVFEQREWPSDVNSKQHFLSDQPRQQAALRRIDYQILRRKRGERIGIELATVRLARLSLASTFPTSCARQRFRPQFALILRAFSSFAGRKPLRVKHLADRGGHVYYRKWHISIKSSDEYDRRPSLPPCRKNE